jgi:O-antigen/teichoic acid export membrane protein
VLVCLSAGALLVGLAAGGIVQVVFGPGFGLTVVALRWMLPGVVALTGARILSADLIGRGKTEYNLLTSMAGFGVTLLTFPVLIQPFGVVGAAAGATTVYTVIFLLSLVWYGRETHRQFKELAIVILPQRKDWHFARELVGSFMTSVRRRKL